MMADMICSINPATREVLQSYEADQVRAVAALMRVRDEDEAIRVS
jgi:hypothetical protein